MASSVLTNCKLYVGEYDLSGFSNQLSLTQEYEEVECTVFGNAARWYLPGLPTVSFEHQGYWSADGTDDPDDAVADKMAEASVPIMVCPTVFCCIPPPVGAGAALPAPPSAGPSHQQTT